MQFVFTTGFLLIVDWVDKIYFINSWLGLFHTATAILAMLFGTLLLLNKKGTKRHKQIGYVYVVNMLLLNISALGIYSFGSVSLFHFFVFVSLFSIIRGIYPVLKRKNKQWLRQHYYNMNWSVIGLYCAFWSEIGVRLFDMKYFWWVVLLATLLTSLIGAIIVRKQAVKLDFNLKNYK